jgi:putative transposase
LRVAASLARPYLADMPRVARFVLPSVPHHVTQRGNRRGRVFYSDADHRTYLSWLREYTTEHEVDVLAYCLMSNHTHLVLVPAARNSLHLALRRLHLRYAQRVNRAHDWRGHLWQGRYFASVLDESYLWAAIRYVELNPVRAGMVERAEDYPWSSARAHCGMRADPVLCAKPQWKRQISAVADWSAWLQEGLARAELETLRRNGPKGLPCGTEQFIDDLEQRTGRCLRSRPRGPRPKLATEKREKREKRMRPQ